MHIVKTSYSNLYDHDFETKAFLTFGELGNTCVFTAFQIVASFHHKFFLCVKLTLIN